MIRLFRCGWFWLATGILVADQLTKAAVLRHTAEHSSREIIPGFFNLVHTRNRGIAFGLLSGSDSPWTSATLSVFAVAAMGVLVWLLATSRVGHHLSRAGIALILGGAAGNLVDRLLHGSVVDFIELYAGNFYWPAFNLADSAITIGAALVVAELLLSGRRPHGDAERQSGSKGP
jgi:signal peptidase II